MAVSCKTIPTTSRSQRIEIDVTRLHSYGLVEQRIDLLIGQTDRGTEGGNDAALLDCRVFEPYLRGGIGCGHSGLNSLQLAGGIKCEATLYRRHGFKNYDDRRRRWQAFFEIQVQRCS